MPTPREDHHEERSGVHLAIELIRDANGKQDALAGKLAADVDELKRQVAVLQERSQNGARTIAIVAVILTALGLIINLADKL